MYSIYHVHHENFQNVSATILRPAENMITHHEFASYGFLEREANWQTREVNF